jgi:Anti-sigma-28 factor, FlgM
MQTHGPSCLEGPISGARAWWQMLEAAAEAPTTTKGYRPELVARIRAAIAAGTYDTPEKWEIALARLLGELESKESGKGQD